MKTIEQLIEEWEKAAGNLSYYNAAEGDNWRREGEGRRKAKSEFNSIDVECAAAGLTRDKLPKGYLI